MVMGRSLKAKVFGREEDRTGYYCIPLVSGHSAAISRPGVGCCSALTNYYCFYQPPRGSMIALFPNISTVGVHPLQ